jgi:hypothetical protein
MSKAFWLSKLTLGELKLMHDLADVIRATALDSAQGSIMAAQIHQEIKCRERARVQEQKSSKTAQNWAAKRVIEGESSSPLI